MHACISLPVFRGMLMSVHKSTASAKMAEYAYFLSFFAASIVTNRGDIDTLAGIFPNSPFLKNNV